mmetsp:Transcript_22819/g.40915  ORF Transcript_22819/g.40915 Transcript_22819/m.40915 type:complete len:287 (+) Transcript_22819:56-916(+)
MRPLPLPPLTPSAVDAMLSQLRTRGFACVSLHPHHRPWIRNALRSALASSSDAATMKEFRFPPIEGSIVYTESKRLAFRALFEVATNCLEGLLLSLNKCGGEEESMTLTTRSSSRTFTEALCKVRGDEARLFGRDENEPFEPSQPFSQSFFNLFNYDHGSLNGHVDRSLLTVIYSTAPDVADTTSSPEKPPVRRSALWVKDRQGTWHDADRVVRPDQALIMVGEDLERAGIAEKLQLFAAEHAVRVDPAGLRIERSHFRRDPGCTEGIGNRLSAAMILRHELEEMI